MPGCFTSSCRYLQVTFTNFPGGLHTIVCRAVPGYGGGYLTYTRSGSSDTYSNCYYGYPRHSVWVTVDDRSSNLIGW